ncbi:MFS transporter small subunit [Nocardia sp. CA-128927]
MTEPASTETAPPRRIPLLVFAWLWVAAPFAYGLDRLIVNLLKLFQ